MHLAKRIIIAAAAAAAATALLSGSAGASTSLRPGNPGSSGTAVTHIYDNGTVPGSRGTWASAWITRTATISGGTPVAAFRCGEQAGPCYSYTALVRDQGRFRAIRGAPTPNQARPGRTITSAVIGRVNGVTPFSFFATARPDPGLVPATDRDAAYPAMWPELFFPAGTVFAGLTGIPFSYGYGASTPCGYQHWTFASSSGYGDLPRDGNITGCRR